MRTHKGAMRRHLSGLSLVFAVWLFLPASAHATDITLGALQFNLDQPQGGLSDFGIYNWTDDLLDPMPQIATDPLTFSNLSLTLTCATPPCASFGTTETLNLSTGLGPDLSPYQPSEFYISSGDSIASAVLTLTLSQTTFGILDDLGNSSTLVLGDANQTFSLLPSSGTSLADGDLAFLVVSGREVTQTPVPEPSTLTLMGSALIGALARQRAKRRKHADCNR